MSIFFIDQQSRVPIYEQLGRQVLTFVASGVMQENEQMPSVRQLASDLCINPNTVQKSYRELEREGLIYSVPGKGSFVSSPQNHIDYVKNVLADRQAEIIKTGLQAGFSAEELQVIFREVLEKMTQTEKKGKVKS